MKTKQKEVENQVSNDDKLKAKWATEALIIKLLIKCIVENYRIAIDNTDGVKVWIESQTTDNKLSEEQKLALIKELVRHIR